MSDKIELLIVCSTFGDFYLSNLYTVSDFIIDYKNAEIAPIEYNYKDLLFNYTNTKFYKFLSKIVWDELKFGATFRLPIKFYDTIFKDVNVQSEWDIMQRLLMLAGDIEIQPGPVMSRFLEVGGPKDFRVTVNAQGVFDILGYSSEIPKNFSNFAKDFSAFVAKIPDRIFVEECAADIKTNCANLLDIVRNTFAKMEAQMDLTCASIDANVSASRKVVFGILMILLIWFALQKMGIMGTLATIIFGFAVSYFDVFANIKDCVLENGKTIWQYLGLPHVDVRVQGFEMDLASNILQDSRASVFFSTIFTSLFVYAVKTSPTTKDLEDLSRKIFNYQKGATSLFTLFDKISDFWSWMSEVIAHKMGIQAGNGKINNWTMSVRINTWIRQNESLFKAGFGDVPDENGNEISFDERKRRRRNLMVQYNEGVDFIALSRYLDRPTMLIIQQWNQRIDKKVAQMSTEALNGEMRNPPTVMLLYGRSGVGKTSLCDGIKALASAVISEVTGTERTSPANVYTRNSDMEHWDGYHGQQFIMFDDLGARKDSEANPNKELQELICAKNSQPFPLKMAHLDDKGKFFTSEFIFCTTNVPNMTAYIKSMTYPEAIITRLSELPYIVRVKPQYRRVMSDEEIKTLKESQIHDQHYVDKDRAQYDIPDDIVRERFPNITWDLKDATKFLTKAQFDSIKPADVKRCADGTPQIVNYNIYYFEPMDPRTGEACGPPIEWAELCEEVEKSIRKRLERGENLLKQQRAFHASSLEDIKRGQITVHVQSADDDDDFKDANSFLVNRENDLNYVVRNKLYKPNDPLVLMLIKHWGEDFEAELIEAILVDAPPTPVHEVEDKVVQVLQRQWDKIWQLQLDCYNKIRQIVLSTPIMKTLKIGGCLVGWLAMVCAFYKGCEMITDAIAPKEILHAKKVIKQEIHEKTKHLPWWKKIFGAPGSASNPIQISRGTLNLTPDQIFTIYEVYNLAVEVQGGGQEYNQYDSVRSRAKETNLKARVATAGFNVSALKEDLINNYKNVSVQGNDDEIIIEFDEKLIHPVLVTVQAHQLTTDAISHVLPHNTYMMDYTDINGDRKSIGNVTFLHDRAILHPYHYVQRLQHDELRKKTLTDDCVFTFSRAPTHLELAKNAPANKIRCTYKNLKNYKRIIAPVFIDDTAHMEKDAVIVHLSGSGISGHNCANIIKKFVKREDLAKINSSGLGGYLVVQRNVGHRSSTPTDIKQTVTLACSSVTPTNVMRRTGNRFFENNIIDFQGEQVLNDDKGVPCRYYITLRDRYEYVAGTQSGDCGAVLWLDHPQLSRCIAGMHSTDHPSEGKGCSVSITQEDIEETLVKLGVCAVNAFVEPDLAPLTEEDVFGPVQLVPQGNFQYIGKKTEGYPMQPMKTNLVPSPIQIHLQTLQSVYEKKTGKTYPIAVKKAPAVMRTIYENPNSCRLFEHKGKIMFQMRGEEARECSYGDYQVWLAKGGIKRDPLMEGLAKNCIHMPYIRSNLIDVAVEHVANKLLKTYNPLSVDAFSKAMAQNNFFITNEMRDKLDDIRSRNRLISDYITSLWPGKKILQFNVHDTFEGLLRSVSLNKEEIDILKQAMLKNYESAEGLDMLLVDFASHSRYDEIDVIKETCPNPMILTIEQSVSGIDGDKTIRSINGKKSPGHPYDQQKKPFGKKWWTGKEMKCDGPGWKELKRDVENLIEEAKTKIPVVYFVDTMKDELRTHEKVKNYKTRIFSAGPMHFSIAFRMYFLRFLSHVMENKIDNESAVGINPYSNDWEKLAQYLTKWGGLTNIAGDYKDYDGSLVNQITEKLLDVVEKFYAQYGSTAEERNIRRNLWTCLTRSLHIARNGGVYRWYNSQPSGNPYTTFINIMFNMVVFRMAYALIFGQATPSEMDILFPDGFPFMGKPPKKTLASFDENVHFIAYGDDNCANINPEIIDWFNMHTISRAMSLLGLTYTDDQKNSSGQVAKARFIEEITFLKRAFRKVDFCGRKWVAPLDIDTVKEILMWVRTQDMVRRDETMIENVQTTCMEMSLHGEEAYNDWVIFLEGLRRNTFLGANFPAIDVFYDQFNVTCNQDYES